MKVVQAPGKNAETTEHNSSTLNWVKTTLIKCKVESFTNMSPSTIKKEEVVYSSEKVINGLQETLRWT